MHLPYLGTTDEQRACLALVTSLLAGLAMPAVASNSAVSPPAARPKTSQAPATSAKTPAQAASASTTPDTQTPAPPGEAVVTIVASRASNQVDRQVYDVKNNLATSNSTAADALNSVPSVSVTPDGQVTLRGNANVQILIDGKPAAMLQGENRGAALNALPAGDIASIEVINTPGAQFGNEGGGGPVLNLVMQKIRRAGGFVVINANAGTHRRNANVSGNYNSGRFGFQGSASVRRDRSSSTLEADRIRIDPLTGAARRSHQSSASRSPNQATSFSAAVNYNLTDDDTVSANTRWTRNDRSYRALDHYVNYGTDDVADSEYERAVTSGGGFDSQALNASWEHRGDTRGEEFSTDLRISGTDNHNGSAYVNTYQLRPPGAMDARSRQFSATDSRITDLTGDYKHPDIAGGTLKAGYKALKQRNNFDTRYFDTDPVTQAEKVNPVRTNGFGVDETIFALYGSYEWRVGERWGLLGGLRAEHTRLEIDQVTSGAHAKHSYRHYIPSFYVTYEVSKQTDIRLSYANRIGRPSPQDLNPFVVYRDEFNASSGNPYLQPSETDSLELGLETKLGKFNTNLRAYHRRDSNVIMERRYFLSDAVLLTTRGNGGSNDSGGLEFTLDGKATTQLNITLSGNLARIEQTTSTADPEDVAKRRATSLSGHARVHFQASKHDMLQLMLHAQGKSLLGQGFRDPSTSADFTYRRIVTPTLSLVLNVNDLFGSSRTTTVTETNLLKETAVRRSSGRAIFLGLNYRVGGFAPTPTRNAAPRKGAT